MLNIFFDLFKIRLRMLFAFPLISSGNVLIIGGYRFTDEVLSYSPDSGVVESWLVNGIPQRLALGRRYVHAAGVFHEQIFVAGGYVQVGRVRTNNIGSDARSAYFFHDL